MTYPDPKEGDMDEPRIVSPDLPAPNLPECSCDRDDDSWVGEPVEMPLCPLHEKRLRHLSWESLACLVIDYEAALATTPPGLAHAAIESLDGLLAARLHNSDDDVTVYDVIDPEVAAELRDFIVNARLSEVQSDDH